MKTKNNPQNPNPQSPLLPGFPLNTCPYLPFRTTVNVSSSLILIHQPHFHPHWSACGQGQERLPCCWIQQPLSQFLTLLEFCAPSDTGRGLLNSVPSQFLWSLHPGPTSLLLLLCLLPRLLFHPSAVPGPPRTMLLTSPSLPWMNLCQSIQESTLICLSGKGIDCKAVSSLNRRKRWIGQTSSGWGQSLSQVPGICRQPLWGTVIRCHAFATPSPRAPLHRIQVLRREALGGSVAVGRLFPQCRYPGMTPICILSQCCDVPKSQAGPVRSLTSPHLPLCVALACCPSLVPPFTALKNGANDSGSTSEDLAELSEWCNRTLPGSWWVSNKCQLLLLLLLLVYLF